MPEDNGERTEQPTARRRQEARSEGRAPRSTDLTAAVSLLGAVLFLYAFGGRLLQELLGVMDELGDPGTTIGALTAPTARVGWRVVVMLVPVLAAMFIITLLAALFQTGLIIAPKKLQPKLSNLSPMRGLKNLFSSQALIRTGLGLLKMTLVAGIGYVTVMGELDRSLSLSGLHTWGILSVSAELMNLLALRLAVVLVVLALLDYAYQRWSHEKSLKMSKQDVKDEMKRMEGDPQIKARQQKVRTEVAMQRIRRDVPQADVVVTNPTEFSVALKYDEDAMTAPRVVAKGADFLALQIRQLAQRHGVPVVQRPPLARGLYAKVEVGQEIPAEFYRAVAELLAYVYRLSRRAARAG